MWDLTANTGGTIYDRYDADITSMVFSSDGARIVTGKVHGSVAEWDVATGIPVFSGKYRSPSFSGAVRTMVFSPDEKKLPAKLDKEGVVVRGVQTGLLWEVEIENCLNPGVLAYLPDGSKFSRERVQAVGSWMQKRET